MCTLFLQVWITAQVQIDWPGYVAVTHESQVSVDYYDRGWFFTQGLGPTWIIQGLYPWCHSKTQDDTLIFQYITIMVNAAGKERAPKGLVMALKYFGRVSPVSTAQFL